MFLSAWLNKPAARSSHLNRCPKVLEQHNMEVQVEYGTWAWDGILAEDDVNDRYLVEWSDGIFADSWQPRGLARLRVRRDWHIETGFLLSVSDPELKPAGWPPPEHEVQDNEEDEEFDEDDNDDEDNN